MFASRRLFIAAAVVAAIIAITLTDAAATKLQPHDPHKDTSIDADPQRAHDEDTYSHHLREAVGGAWSSAAEAAQNAKHAIFGKQQETAQRDYPHAGNQHKVTAAKKVTAASDTEQESAIEAAQRLAKTTAEAVGDAATAAVEKTGDMLQNVKDTVADAVPPPQKVAKNLQGAASSAWQMTLTALEKTGEFVASLPDPLGPTIHSTHEVAHGVKAQAKGKFGVYKDKAKDKFDELKGKSAEKSDDAQSKAGDVKEQAKGKFEELKDKAGDVKEQAKDKFEELKDKAQDKFDELKGKSAEKSDDAQSKAGDVKEQAKGKFEELKDKAQDKFDASFGRPHDAKPVKETHWDAANAPAGRLEPVIPQAEEPVYEQLADAMARP
jgi:hypothetical protein